MSSKLLLDQLYLASSNPYPSFKPVGSSELLGLKLSLTTSSCMKGLKDTAACALDELEIAYEKECQEHAVVRVGGSYVQRGQQLAKEVDSEDFAGDVEVQQDPLDHRRAVPALLTDKECTCHAEESSRRKGEEEEGLNRYCRGGRRSRRRMLRFESSRWACDNRT
jgi:hypothetical protein